VCGRKEHCGHERVRDGGHANPKAKKMPLWAARQHLLDLIR